MTIQRDKDTNTYVITCDKCPEYIDTETRDFQEATAIAKKAGWRSHKNDKDEWVHSCPPCVEDFAKGNRPS